MAAFVLAMPTVAASSALDFRDPAGDVTRSSNGYSGPGAAAVDVLGVRLREEGATLVFELDLDDLNELRGEVRKAGFHAQYSLSFYIEETTRAYSMRALFGGHEYTGAIDGKWRFQIHHQIEDDWPSADGRADGSTLVWEVPRTELDLRSGDTLAHWRVQTWSGYEGDDQYGDWAQTGATYVVGEGARGTPMLSPVWVLVAVAALALRRRPS